MGLTGGFWAEVTLLRVNRHQSGTGAWEGLVAYPPFAAAFLGRSLAVRSCQNTEKGGKNIPDQLQRNWKVPLASPLFPSLFPFRQQPINYSHTCVHLPHPHMGPSAMPTPAPTCPTAAGTQTAEAGGHGGTAGSPSETAAEPNKPGFKSCSVTFAPSLSTCGPHAQEAVARPRPCASGVLEAVGLRSEWVLLLLLCPAAPTPHPVPSAELESTRPGPWLPREEIFEDHKDWGQGRAPCPKAPGPARPWHKGRHIPGSSTLIFPLPSQLTRGEFLHYSELLLSEK